MDYQINLETMVKNVKALVREARRQGTTGMGYECLRQCVSTRGITIHPSRFDELLRDAIKTARLSSWII